MRVKLCKGGGVRVGALDRPNGWSIIVVEKYNTECLKVLRQLYILSPFCGEPPLMLLLILSLINVNLDSGHIFQPVNFYKG